MHESDRIGTGGGPDRLIVERYVSVTARLAHGSRERRLPALTRAVDQDCRAVAKRFPKTGREVAREGRSSPGHVG